MEEKNNMAKANQFHRAGNTFRNINFVKIPVEERTHNKNKWKSKEISKKQKREIVKEKKSNWWKKKLMRKKDVS